MVFRFKPGMGLYFGVLLSLPATAGHSGFPFRFYCFALSLCVFFLAANLIVGNVQNLRVDACSAYYI